MIEPLLELDPGGRKRLAHALATGSLSLRPTAIALRAAAGIECDEELLKALAALESRGLDGRGAAAVIETLDAIESRKRKPDLVWSGPEVPGVPARDTRQVFEELISGAQRSLWLSSFTYFDGPKTFATLAARMEAQPHLRVRLLLNIQRPRGDTTVASDLVARFAYQFWTRDWPGGRRPDVYYAPSSLDMESGSKSVLHAKVVIADEEKLFVTSANLTEAAFDHNIEAGLLVRDGVLALSMVRHFMGLIERQVLVRLP